MSRMESASGFASNQNLNGKVCCMQLAAIACTVAIALFSGSLAGLLVARVNPAGHFLSPEQLFDDGAYWQVGVRLCLGVLRSLHISEVSTSCPSSWLTTAPAGRQKIQPPRAPRRFRNWDVFK